MAQTKKKAQPEVKMPSIPGLGASQRTLTRNLKQLCCLAALITQGCLGASSTARPAQAGAQDDPSARAYASAMEAFDDEDCLTAEPAFSKVRKEYPFTRFAALSELRIADCMDRQAKYAEAAQAYRQFARLRPSHPEVAYARFKSAEAELNQAPQDWFLSPPAHERDQRFTKAALRSLQSFLNDFSDSPFSEEARELVAKAEQTLAGHELYVARFYLERDEPAAAIVRLRAMLRTYEASGLEAEAMVLMGRTQVALQRLEEARKTFEDVIERFPDSGMAKQARRYLDAVGS